MGKAWMALPAIAAAASIVTPAAAGQSAYSRIEAETAALTGANVATLAGASGGKAISRLGDGDVARVRGVEFGLTPLFQAYLMAASASSGSATVKLRLDSVNGPVLATFAVGATGGATKWKLIPMNTTGRALGTRDVV